MTADELRLELPSLDALAEHLATLARGTTISIYFAFLPEGRDGGHERFVKPLLDIDRRVDLVAQITEHLEQRRVPAGEYRVTARVSNKIVAFTFAEIQLAPEEKPAPSKGSGKDSTSQIAKLIEEEALAEVKRKLHPPAPAPIPEAAEASEEEDEEDDEEGDETEDGSAGAIADVVLDALVTEKGQDLVLEHVGGIAKGFQNLLSAAADRLRYGAQKPGATTTPRSPSLSGAPSSEREVQVRRVRVVRDPVDVEPPKGDKGAA